MPNWTICNNSKVITSYECSGCIVCVYRHLKTKHPNNHAAYERSKVRGHLKSNLTLTQFLNKSDNTSYSSSHPKQKLMCKSIIENLVVRAGLPISVVENEGFRRFLADLDPLLVAPCRKTVTHTYLPQILAEKRMLVANLLSEASDVSLTVDIWTDRRQHSYIAITAHTFDVKKGLPHSMLMKFQSFKGSHTGDSIAAVISDGIADVGVQSKVHYIVTDNASNMRKALSFVFAAGDMESLVQSTSDNEGMVTVEDNDSLIDDPELFQDFIADELESSLTMFGERVPCFAHSLQLTVRDGLHKITLSRTAVAKCCKLANLLHQSALVKQAFEEAFGDCRCVPSSNDTRWNSLFSQLKYVVTLDSVKLSNMLKAVSQSNLILTVKEIQQLREVVEILDPFAQATDLSQGSKYVTISCIVPVILSLNSKLSQLLTVVKFNQSLITELISSLYDRFAGIFAYLQIPRPSTARFSSTGRSRSNNLHFDSNIYPLSACLDPHHAYRWLELHPGSLVEKEAMKIKMFGK